MGLHGLGAVLLIWPGEPADDILQSYLLQLFRA